MELLLIPMMAVLGRLSGWGFDGFKRFAWFPAEVFFALPFAAVASKQAGGSITVFILAWAVSYLAFQLGHGNAYHDGMLRTQFADRWQTLDYVVRPLCRALMWLGMKCGYWWDLSPRSTGYCRIFMGIKGLLIGLPILGPGTIAMAILWPLAYAISFRVMKRDSLPAEWCSGGFAGAVLCATLAFSAWNLYTGNIPAWLL